MVSASLAHVAQLVEQGFRKAQAARSSRAVGLKFNTWRERKTMTISEFQHLIEKIYYEKDNKRRVEKSFLWFAEEIGELAGAIREKDKKKLKAEFSDVFAWLAGLANLLNIDLEEIASVYNNGCPNCGKLPCQCVEPE